MDIIKKIEPFEKERFPFRISNSVNEKRRKYMIIPHWHEHLELIKIIRGSASITNGINQFNAEKDDIIFFNSCNIHYMEAPPESDTELKGIIFDKFFATDTTNGFETKYLYSLFSLLEKVDKKYDMKHPLWNELNEFIENTYNEYVHQEIGFEMVIKSNILKMMATLLRYYKNELDSNSSIAINASEFIRLKPVLDYIDKNFTNRIQLNVLCNLVNMNKSYFIRYFKKVTGSTPIEYINKIRINTAKKMLIDTDLTVSEICEKAGYCNINYFDTVFKKFTGITPMDFKKKLIASSKKQ